MTRGPLSGAKRWLAEGRRPEVVFMLRFAGIAGLLCALYAFPYGAESGVREWFESYLAAYASAAGTVLHAFDPAVRVSGADIAGRFSLRIVKDCDAMDVNILFAAAVLSFPASWSRRALGLSIGVAAILVANISRICALYFIGVSVPGAFEFAHRDLFPLLLVLLATAVFLPWARAARGPEPAPSGHVS
jgi:exosortase H (IPTLxxWG-CTERM-specific)